MSAKLALMPRGHRHRSLPQSSSASRFTAGAFGFFILSQPGKPWALACLRAARSHVLYKGIAERPFERSFQLADYVVVKGARLESGSHRRHSLDHKSGTNQLATD